jgi:hypothetical protein
MIIISSDIFIAYRLNQFLFKQVSTAPPNRKRVNCTYTLFFPCGTMINKQIHPDVREDA